MPRLLPADLRDVVLGVSLAVAGDDELDDRYAVAAWSVIVEPGDAVAGAVLRALGARLALAHLVAGTLGATSVEGVTAGQLRAAVARWTPRAESRAVASALRIAQHTRVTLLTPADGDWPVQLDDLGWHAPLCLWVRGRVDVLGLTDPSVALVGARASTHYGDVLAGEFAAELAGTGIPIVSGAAYGIDGAAHRGALAAGGPTVALLAGGVDRPYPSGHTDLIGRIADAGAVVAEAPCGGVPSRWRFLQRNRLIAALSRATVVVEAGSRSGSLNTAGHAATLGRPLGAVPGPVTSAASAGCHRLFREYGAECVTTAAEIRMLLGIEQDSVADDGERGGRPSTRIIDALSTRAWRSAGEIARRSGMATRDVETALGYLALEGAVERGDAGWRFVPAARR